MNKVVRINANGTPVSGDDPMKVKKNTDTLAWAATGNGGPWIITFTGGSPISANSVTVAKGSASNQFPVTGGANRYPYTIAAEGSSVAQDPDIVVED